MKNPSLSNSRRDFLTKTATAAAVAASATLFNTPVQAAPDLRLHPGGVNRPLEAAQEHLTKTLVRTLANLARGARIQVKLETILFAVVPRGRILASVAVSEREHVFYLSHPSSGLAAGLYLAVVDPSGLAMFFFIDPRTGRRIPFDFQIIEPGPDEPMPFHTPLGDDMCKNAPDLIKEFCQRFVACAAYDLFC